MQCAETPAVNSVGRKVAELFRQNRARRRREGGLDEAGVRRGCGRQGQLETRLRRQADFLADCVVRVHSQRCGLCGIATLDTQRQNDAVFVAKGLAAVGFGDSFGGGKDGLYLGDVVRAGEVEGRRHAGVARVAPVGDCPGREPYLEARQTLARRDEARLRFRAARPIGREFVGGASGSRQRAKCDDGSWDNPHAHALTLVRSGPVGVIVLHYAPGWNSTNIEKSSRWARPPEASMKRADPPPSTSLEGQFLIAMPSLRGGPFARSVVYLCAHRDDGAR